jgi:hypothetical protein
VQALPGIVALALVWYASPRGIFLSAY